MVGALGPRLAPGDENSRACSWLVILVPILQFPLSIRG